MRKCKKKIGVLLILSMLMCSVSPFSVEQVQAAKYKTAIDKNGQKIKYLAYSEPDCQGYVGQAIQSLKGGYIEGYWDLNTKQKMITVDIDKMSANDFVKKVHSYGEKGIKNKITYLIKLKHKQSTDMYAYAHKVKKASANTYGISMGVQSDLVAANEIVYLEKQCDKAFKKNFNCYQFEDYIKSKKELKELDDSSKVYFISNFICGGMFYDYIETDKGFIYGSHKHKGYYSFELIYKKKACGVCQDMAWFWKYLVSKIVADKDYSYSFIKPPHHIAVLFKIKNAKGQFEYYIADVSDYFRTFSKKYPKKYFSDSNMYNAALKQYKKRVQPYIMDVIDAIDLKWEKKAIRAEEEAERLASIEEHKAGKKFICTLRSIDSEKVKFIVMTCDYPDSDITSRTFYSVPSSDTTDYQSERELAQKYKAYTVDNPKNTIEFGFITKKEWKRTIYFAFTYAGGERGLIKLDKTSDAEVLSYSIITYTVIS